MKNFVCICTALIFFIGSMTFPGIVLGSESRETKKNCTSLAESDNIIAADNKEKIVIKQNSTEEREVEDDLKKLKQDIDELRKAVNDIQKKMGVEQEKPAISLESAKPIDQIYKLLGGKRRIIVFNLKGFCVSENKIFTHENGFAGIAEFSSSLFFVPSDMVEKNRSIPEKQIEKFFSIFSNSQRITLLRALVNRESKSSAKLREETGLTEGQFYHHTKELLSANCLQKDGQDKYKISDQGKIILILVEALTKTLIETSYEK